MNILVKKNILGVDITDASEDEVLEYIWESLEKKGSSYYIVTPNPEMIVASQESEKHRALLNNARISLCDGAGLFWASKVLGKSLKQRLTGVDLMELVCKESVRKPVSIGFLGGRGSVAQRSAECLLEKYRGMKISYVSEEWNLEGFEKAKKYQESSKRHPQHVDILFVAFGFPKQEIWMAEHVGKLPFHVAVGVGGAFDYFSGEVKRAPKIHRTLGLEWLYRLLQQPWRWRRQLALLKFVGLVVKERFGK